MNISEAKSILMLYRPGTADAEDPQIAEALVLAESNAELGAWLEARTAQQDALRAKFRQIALPAGLKEQIISEHAAGQRPVSARASMRRVLAAVALLVLVGTLAILHFRPTLAENTLALYRGDMVSLALRDYPMGMTTNDPASVRAYLAENHAPANFRVPPSLRKTTIVGCGALDWQGAKVSLVCFHTGKPLPPGVPSDLWLFVVDRSALKNPPDANVKQLEKVNRLMTVTWTEGSKLYLLGLAGDESELKQYL